jgi:hypothetical protein
MKRRGSGLFFETCVERGWLRDGTWAEEPVERPLRREELAEAYRLWRDHADIRKGQVKP